jgi:hypothetical protein
VGVQGRLGGGRGLWDALSSEISLPYKFSIKHPMLCGLQKPVIEPKNIFGKIYDKVSS